MEVHTSTTVGYKETVGYCELSFFVIKEKITEIVDEYRYIEGDLSCNYLEEGEFQPNGCSTPLLSNVNVHYCIQRHFDFDDVSRLCIDDRV